MRKPLWLRRWWWVWSWRRFKMERLWSEGRRREYTRRRVNAFRKLY